MTKPYAERTKDLQQDTKEFLKTELGVHIIRTLQQKAEGELSSARRVNEPYADRYVQRYAAIQETIEFIREPLDDDISPRG